MFRTWASDEEVTRFLTWPAHEDVKVTSCIIADWYKGYEAPDYYQWAIELKETGEPIGSIAAEMATELEEPWKPMIAMVIYGGITLALSLIHRMGLDRTGLDKQLKQRHISSAKEVFLAVCDRNLKFVLFKK